METKEGEKTKKCLGCEASSTLLSEGLELEANECVEHTMSDEAGQALAREINEANIGIEGAVQEQEISGPLGHGLDVLEDRPRVTEICEVTTANEVRCEGKKAFQTTPKKQENQVDISQLQGIQAGGPVDSVEIGKNETLVTELCEVTLATKGTEGGPLEVNERQLVAVEEGGHKQVNGSQCEEKDGLATCEIYQGSLSELGSQTNWSLGENESESEAKETSHSSDSEDVSDIDSSDDDLYDMFRRSTLALGPVTETADAFRLSSSVEREQGGVHGTQGHGGEEGTPGVEANSDGNTDRRGCRPRVKCPLGNCGRMVQDLPRHIRSPRCHGKDVEYVEKASYIRNLFPDMTKSASKTPRKQCAYCGSYQTSVSKHQQTCKMKKEFDCINVIYGCRDDEDQESDIELALCKFKTDLKGPDFMLSDYQAKCSQNMLRRFMRFGSMKSTRELLRERKLREAYLELSESGLKASSRNNYLRVVKDYLDTVMIVGGTGQRTVPRLKIILDKWIKNSKHALKRDRYSHKLKSQKNIITPAEMGLFEDSDYVKHVKRYLKKCSGQSKSYECDMIDSRAYITIRLAVENGQRAGSMSHMTIDEFNERERNDDGSATIKVAHHKTCESHGPSILRLSPELHVCLTRYVKHVRPLCQSPDGEDNHVFLSERGSGMSSSQLTYGAKMFWKRATKTNKDFNFTIVRKSVTTNVRQQTKNDSNTAVLLANQMTHAKATADKHYDLTKNSPEEQRLIHSTICEAMGLKVCCSFFFYE